MRQTFDAYLLSYQRFHNLPVIYRYLYPTLMIILGIGLHLAFSEVIGSLRFLFIYPMVFLCAWFFGTGPGLYISRLIVEAHQDSLTVKSQLGQGSTFIVALPLLGSK